MLAREHRITSARDYKHVVRRGKRVSGAHTVTYVLMNPNGGPPRFGFIVAKTVGNAVVRNRVRRRLKSCAFSMIETFPKGAEVVVRALPTASTAPYASLHHEISAASARLSRMTEVGGAQ